MALCISWQRFPASSSYDASRRRRLGFRGWRLTSSVTGATHRCRSLQRSRRRQDSRSGSQASAGRRPAPWLFDRQSSHRVGVNPYRRGGAALGPARDAHAELHSLSYGLSSSSSATPRALLGADLGPVAAATTSKAPGATADAHLPRKRGKRAARPGNPAKEGRSDSPASANVQVSGIAGVVSLCRCKFARGSGSRW
jgi:hypothetical protein